MSRRMKRLKKQKGKKVNPNQYPHRYNGTNASTPITEKTEGVPLNPKPGLVPGAEMANPATLRKMIWFSETAYAKMNYLIAHCDVEIAWLGTVTEMDDCYYVEDVHIFEQEVTGGEAELKGEDIGNFILNYMQEHGDEAGIELNNKLRLWGHSHVNMGVGPSGTDESTIKELFDTNMDFFIRVIGNKKGEMNVDLYRHFHCRQLEHPIKFTWKNTAWDVLKEFPAVDASFHEEMLTKVKRKSYTTTKTHTPSTSVVTTKQDEKKTVQSLEPLRSQNSRIAPSLQTTNSGGETTSMGSTDDVYLTANRSVWWTSEKDIEDFEKRFFQGLPVGIEEGVS